MKSCKFYLIFACCVILVAQGGCAQEESSSSGPDVSGIWNFHSYNTQDSNEELGTLDLKKDGSYTYDVTSTWYGHRIGGGTWTYTNTVLEINDYWYQWDGGGRIDHDPWSYRGVVTSGSGAFQLKAGDFIWTVELSRGAKFGYSLP